MTQFVVSNIYRKFSTTSIACTYHYCRLLVVGGGSAGCTIASKFAKNLRKNEIIVLEPKVDHLYQSMFTLIGAGVKNMRDAWRPMAETLPQNVTWFNDSVDEFDPKNDTVRTKNGKVIQYQFVVIAVGIKPDYYKVTGLKEALDHYPEVVTIYAPEYAEKTFKSFNNFVDGNAVFTHPSTPVKCPGASQKICYLAEHYFRKKNKRHGADIIYTIGYPDIFQVKKYADALWKVTRNRSIEVYLNTDLKQVDPETRMAVFECSEIPGEKIHVNYSLLHVTPPMSPPDELQACEELVNADGYVDVNQYTLRHNKFDNAYAIGDCIGTANSKTTSAIGAQSVVVYNNLLRAMCGKEPSLKYNGYSACPIITSYGTCILAEFDYSFNPLETFPVEQDVERQFTYFLKKELMPKIYWNFLLKGLWDGPENFRKVFHFKIRS